MERQLDTFNLLTRKWIREATYLNSISNIADQHFYDEPSQDMAQLRRICEQGDGSFALH